MAASRVTCACAVLGKTSDRKAIRALNMRTVGNSLVDPTYEFVRDA